MKIRGWWLLALGALLVGACSTDVANKPMPRVAVPELIQGKVITAPIRSEASVGDVMLTAGEYAATPTTSKLPAFSLDRKRRADVSHKLKDFVFYIPEGEYVLLGTSDEGSFYAAPAPIEEARRRTGYGGLFVPNGAEPVATEVFWQWNRWIENYRTFYSAALAEPIPVTIGVKIRSLGDGSASGPRATVTYAGVAGGQIRFVYKEFTADGMARAAFTQEVGLDYRPGEVYAYKDARFTVERADTTHIEFTLIHGL